MINDTILSIIMDENDDGTCLNDLVDQFRDGSINVEQLLQLLDSDNSELISIGLWILSELDYFLYNFSNFNNRLYKLTEHPSANVRFSAISALFPAFSKEDSTTQETLKKLVEDSNEGVRLSAKAAQKRLGII